MEKQTFTTVIKPKSGWFDLHLKEVFAYRDLIYLFVKRNFVSKYKQTILGPAWAVIQPLLTTVVFTLVFGNIAGLSPDGVPPFIFYLAGTVLWTYFSGCLTQTANTFVANSATMGKVYFPRLVMPISTVFSGTHQLCHPVWLSADLSGLLHRHKAGCASESLDAHDPAHHLAVGDAEPWLWHHHFRADYEIPRPCHAGRLRRTAMDVWLTNCL